MQSRCVERHEDMSPTGTLKLIMEPDGDIIVAVKPDLDDPMQSSVFGYTVQFCAIGSGGGRSSRTRKALADLMEAMYLDNLEEESARGEYNDPPPSMGCSDCNELVDTSNPDSILFNLCNKCLEKCMNDLRNGR